jgi:hypothetical protein
MRMSHSRELRTPLGASKLFTTSCFRGVNRKKWHIFKSWSTIKKCFYNSFQKLAFRREFPVETIILLKFLKGTVQRNLRWVLSNINQFVSLWAVVASPWFCQRYGSHFEIHEKCFSTIKYKNVQLLGYIKSKLKMVFSVL